MMMSSYLKQFYWSFLVSDKSQCFDPYSSLILFICMLYLERKNRRTMEMN